MSLLAQVERLHAALLAILDALDSRSAAAQARLERALECGERAWEGFDAARLGRLRTECRRSEALAEAAGRVVRLQRLLAARLTNEAHGVAGGLERLREFRRRLHYYAQSGTGRSCDLLG